MDRALMVNVRSWEPSRVCSYVSLGVVVVVWYSAYAPSREEVLVQQHPWFSLESQVWSKNIACLYGVSILVGKWRATVVQRCKIICDMSYNTLMVVQHTHTKVRIILRLSKFVQHSYELALRCATSYECSSDPMQLFESQSAASEFLTYSKVRGDLMWPILSHKTNAMHCATEATGHTNC